MQPPDRPYVARSHPASNDGGFASVSKRRPGLASDAPRVSETAACCGTARVRARHRPASCSIGPGSGSRHRPNRTDELVAGARCRRMEALVRLAPPPVLADGAPARRALAWWGLRRCRHGARARCRGDGGRRELGAREGRLAFGKSAGIDGPNASRAFAARGITRGGARQGAIPERWAFVRLGLEVEKSGRSAAVREGSRRPGGPTERGRAPIVPSPGFFHLRVRLRFAVALRWFGTRGRHCLLVDCRDGRSRGLPTGGVCELSTNRGIYSKPGREHAAAAWTPRVMLADAPGEPDVLAATPNSQD